MEAHCLDLSLPATPAAATAARRRLADKMRSSWGSTIHAEVLHDAELVAAELLGNAVTHAGPGPVSVTATLDDGVLRIEVQDANGTSPSPRLPHGEDERGRGLFIVRALTDRFGVEPHPAGKRVWAEITTGVGRRPFPGATTLASSAS
ncbi:ATP-binding protein [Streptomyces lavendofoliae]|uniref:ATP-binding protein n=1 Tax=Streptomyces lavendofoliae TaxID=67314 RepID=UPI003D9500FD